MNEPAITDEAILRMLREILSMPVALDLEKPNDPVDVLSRQPTQYIFNPGYQAFITSIMCSFLQSIRALEQKYSYF